LFLSLTVFSCVTLVSLLIGFVRLRHRQWNVLDPIAAFWFGFAVYYGLGNVWFCLEVLAEGYYSRGSFDFDPGTDTQANALLHVARLTVLYGLAVAIGMFGPLANTVSVCIEPISRRLAYVPDLGWGLLVPLSIIHWFKQFNAFSLTWTFVPSVASVLPFACCLALNAKLSYNATIRASAGRIALALGVLSLSAMAGATTGMKEALAAPCVAAFGGLMMGLRRPAPVIAAIVLGIPVFLALQSWNKAARSSLWDPTVTLSPGQRVAAVGDAAAIAVRDDTAESSSVGMNRLCTAVPMMQTMELIDGGDGISTVDGLVIPHVPRALWPDKPLVLVGEVLYSRFSGNPGGSSSSPGQPAEAYMYGGWVGVIAIGVAVGLLGAAASTIIGQLWTCRHAAAIGTLCVVAIKFGKCENWLWAYLPALLNCVLTLIVLQLTHRAFAAIHAERETVCLGVDLPKS
jgi:hypothetical protein